MEIGDKVRLLRSKEEGIICRFVDNRTVEIEIEDGFTIPVLKSEIVPISKEESERFPSSEKPKPPAVEKGKTIESFNIDHASIDLVLEIKGMDMTIWLMNITPATILYTIHSKTEETLKGILHGTLKKFDHVKLDTWDLREQDSWPVLIFDILYFNPESNKYTPPMTKKLQLTDRNLIKKPEYISSLKIQGIRLSISEDPVPIDPEKIKESFYKNEEAAIAKDRSTLPENPVIDLHIEALVNKEDQLREWEILEIQLSFFEKKLEEAVINNANTITFIHGVGSGTLRYQIHKKLSQYPHIKYYEDAQKEKFGYGATKVHLK